MRTLIAIALGILIVAFAHTSQATMLEQWDTSRLTQESKWIQVGEVTSKWSSWDPQRKIVYTFVKLRVDETLKGNQKSEVLIRVPGGQSGKYGVVVHGVASFRRGERALVFLKQDRDGAPSVVGMGQGKYRIYKNRVNGEDTALYRTPENVEFFTRGDSGRIRHLVTHQKERRIPLSTLMGEIRASMKTGSPMAH